MEAKKQMDTFQMLDEMFPFRRFTDGSKVLADFAKETTTDHSFHSDASQMEAKPETLVLTLSIFKFPFRRFTDGSKVVVLSISLRSIYLEFPFRRFTDGSKVAHRLCSRVWYLRFHSDASQMEAKA